MNDYILNFPSKEVAEQFGVANGFSTEVDGVIQTVFASHEYAIHEIGAHNGFGYWFLFRDLVDIPVPPQAEQYIVWASTSGEPRPTDESVPDVFWA